jgi:phage-related baseplate assembly protein
MSHRLPDTTRLATLAVRRDQIAARLAAMEARTRTAVRKADDRRKFLLGAFVLREMETDASLRNRVAALLPGFLTRPADQALFVDLLGEAFASALNEREDV